MGMTAGLATSAVAAMKALSRMASTGASGRAGTLLFRHFSGPHPMHEYSQVLHSLGDHALVGRSELLSKLVEQVSQPDSVQLMP